MPGGRPNLVRADTLDLQDQEAPTAAEHHKHIDHDGIAPHQATQFHNVQEERRSEEEVLADAWNMAGQHSAENGANGQADGEQQQKKSEGTGAANGEAEEDSDADEDDEDDDDMMDRMSSSPSIGDGAFTNDSFTAATIESLQEGPGTPQHAIYPRATANQSPNVSPLSSPFVDTPEHMPLRLTPSPSRGADVLISAAGENLSPTVHTPDNSPLVTKVTFGRVTSISSEHHRLNGRYQAGLDLDLGDEGFSEDENQRASEIPVLCQKSRGNAFAQQAQGRTCNDTKGDQANEEGNSNQQKPKLLDDPFIRPPPSPTQSDDSWESDSSEDLTEQDLKDDDADAFLDLDDRFIDSGWGGECLRETEDIDFEFVYALHTFVATVEGQANATKGDTMVLLDDSNSYWWLVRVVKDSSIGMHALLHVANMNVCSHGHTRILTR